MVTYTETGFTQTPQHRGELFPLAQAHGLSVYFPSLG